VSNEIVPSTEVATEIVALEGEIADHSSSYWRGPQAVSKQSRYRDLLLARQNGTAAPRPDAKSQELLAIEALMAQPGSKYWRGPLAEAMQQRYRLLVGGEAPSTADSWRTTPAVARQSLDPAVVAAWGEGDHFEASLRRAQDVAANVVGSLDRDAATQLENVFNGLPDSLQTEIFREIGRPQPGVTKIAADADMETFRQTPGSAETIQLWGREAHRRVGIALDRLARIENSVTPEDRVRLKHFWNTSPARERQLMLWALGNS